MYIYICIRVIQAVLQNDSLPLTTDMSFNLITNTSEIHVVALKYCVTIKQLYLIATAVCLVLATLFYLRLRYDMQMILPLQGLRITT